ncbi:rod shape-determining protein MreC [Candidatus Microgenomates bacterium]|nr:rod shape-determining protein MreC [Candidatus Microgenomates bacterium]
MEKEVALKSLPSFFFFLLLSLLILFLNHLGLFKPLIGATEITEKPVKQILYQTAQGTRNTFGFLTFWRSGNQKLKALEEKNRELLVAAQKAEGLEKENRALRAQLEISDSSLRNLAPAKIIGLSRYLSLDKGDKNGVEVGQIVIFKNFLIGKVVEAGPFTSQVQLPLDPESKIPVQTEKTAARGFLVGEFGKKAILGKVTQGEKLTVEDLVLTSGEGDYPKDLIIGKIESVKKEENAVFQEATVKPLIDFDTLEEVFIIID